MGRDLAQRVQQSTEGELTAQNTQQAPAQRPLDQQIHAMSQEFQRALPAGGAEATQLVRDGLTCLRTTRTLANCEPATVLGGLMTCAQLGLRPGVLGHAWLLPFWDKHTRTHRAQFVIGYQGYVDLAFRSGLVTSIDAHTIHSGEYYQVKYGLHPVLEHTPVLDGDPGTPIAYYATVHLTNGGEVFRVIPHTEMLEHRDKHAMNQNGPWHDQFDAMAHKTCVRRLSKYMPKSSHFATALAADETVRTDTSADADPAWNGEHVDTEVIDADASEEDEHTDT